MPSADPGKTLGPPIRRQLDALRRRERLLAVFWIVARVVAASALLLALSCLFDWIVDLYRDTPGWLRVLLLVTQVAVWVDGVWLAALALWRPLPDESLALRVEEHYPQLRHRLISAVQFSRPGARTEGMSPELIAAMTGKAEAECGKVAFAEVADGSRLRKGLLLLLPVVVVLLLAALAFPVTAGVLLARQFLADRDIPRRVSLAVGEPVVWPAGEENELRVSVRGARHDQGGVVRAESEGGLVTRHDLAFASEEDGEQVFTARIPPGEAGLTWTARLGDGRTRRAGEVRYEPRPVVQRVDAWVQLPASVGLRPNRRPYEETQKAGDVVYRLPGSRARLVVAAQKPVEGGEVEVLGPAASGEQVLRKAALTTTGAGDTLEGGFDLLPGDTAYRVWVTDQYGFRNREPYRRAVRTAPLEAPEVAFLPEVFSRAGDAGPAEDREVEGIPVLQGQRFRLDYKASARYGLARAQLRYRVVPKGGRGVDDSGAVQEGEFLTLLLGGPRSPNEFRLLPTADPDQVPDAEAVGGYDCSVAGLSDGKGGAFEMKPGDRVQFYVEVFSKADPEGRPGRTAVREKEVVELKEYLAWLEKKEDLKEKARTLEEKQRGTRGGRE